MAPGERQTPQAVRIDAADRRQQLHLVGRQRDIIGQDRRSLALAAGDEDAAQAAGVQAIATSDTPEPGREQFIAIGARDDRQAARAHHRAAVGDADRVARRPADGVIETSGRMRSSPKL